jgi:ABC-2 type transport system ATP-binding protein
MIYPGIYPKRIPGRDKANESIISARGLSKRYRRTLAVDHIDLEIPEGRIVGLIGPNGAGKTTVMKAILGLTTFEGELEVLGLNPATRRAELMENVCFIADVAVLPRWISVWQPDRTYQSITPRFAARYRRKYLPKQDHPATQSKQLSKAWSASLHLAVVSGD